MSNDPNGTTPGLPDAQPKRLALAMKCRDQGCTSVAAYDVTPGAGNDPNRAPATRYYECASCGFPWQIQAGGFFPY
jgi:hypothetical protein